MICIINDIFLIILFVFIKINFKLNFLISTIQSRNHFLKSRCIIGLDLILNWLNVVKVVPATIQFGWQCTGLVCLEAVDCFALLGFWREREREGICLIIKYLRGGECNLPFFETKERVYYKPLCHYCVPPKREKDFVKKYIYQN